MPTYLAPGVYVEEVDKGPKPIEAVATAVAGFVGIAARGPLNRPIAINSWSDYVRVFGGFAKDSLMSYSVFGYFNNGGQNAYVVRVANPETMTRARQILQYRPVGRRSQIPVAGGFNGAGTQVALLAGTTQIGLANPAYIAPGDTVRVADGTNTESHTVAAVDLRTGMVKLSAALEHDFTGSVSVTVTEQAATAERTLAAAAMDAAQLTLSDVSGVAVGADITIAVGTSSVTARVVAADSASKVITLAAPVRGTLPAGSKVTMGTSTPEASYQPVGMLRAGSTAAVVDTVKGLPQGTILEIRQGATAEVVTVSKLSAEAGRKVTFAPALAHAYESPTVTVRPDPSFPTAYALAESVVAGADSVRFTDARGLAVGDRVAFWETADAPEFLTVASIDGSEVTFTGTLTNSYSVAAQVVPHPGLQLQAAPDPAAVAGANAAHQSGGKGSWGNDLQVRVDESSLVRTNLMAALAAGAQEATLKSAKGIAVGSLLRFADRKTGVEEYCVVTKVYTDSARVEWTGALQNAFIVADTDVSTVEFRLTVRHRWSGATEVFDGLSMETANAGRFVANVVNGAGGDGKASALVEVASLLKPTWTDLSGEFKLPQAMKKGVWLNLRGGRNGSDGLTVDQIKGQNLGPDNRTGLAGFEGVDQITMVVCADAVGASDKGETLFGAAGTQAVQQALLEHAELMSYRFAIIDARKGADLQAVQEQRENLASKYGALYYPWISVDNPLDEKGGALLVPPSGHIAGLYARVDQQRGVHKAPANELLFGVRSLEVQVSTAEQNLLNPMGINCIRFFPGRGIRVWGARTLADDAQWQYINVRRLFLQIGESIEQGTQWTVFEPNDAGLWAKIRRDVNAFLHRFYQQGALFGATPEEAFYVKCDAETNTPEMVDAGQVVIEVGIAPVKPAEFVVFRIGQKATGGAVSE